MQSAVASVNHTLLRLEVIFDRSASFSVHSVPNEAAQPVWRIETAGCIDVLCIFCDSCSCAL